MKYQVRFRLQPTSPWKEVHHLFSSEKSADRYMEAILLTAPLCFNPEVEVSEYECEHPKNQLDSTGIKHTKVCTVCEEFVTEADPREEPEYSEGL